MSDDRPKKSWREIDAKRDRSGGSSSSPRGPKGAGRNRTDGSQAYRSYKSNLDKLFTPGSGAELPESLKSKLEPRDGASRAERERLADLKQKADAPSLQAFLASGQSLPDDDPRFLMRLLDVDDEESLRPVITTLTDIVESGKKPNRMLLIQKIDALIMRYEDGETVELAQQLRALL